MKTNVTTLLICSAILVTTLWANPTLIAGTSPHTRYYLTAVLMISGILLVITIFRLIRWRLNLWTPSGKTIAGAIPDRPRQNYRIRFDNPPRPVFVENNHENHPVPEFKCDILDISESGVCLGCTGTYKQGDTVIGTIIFESGRTAPINGTVVREESDRICLHLHCTIDPPLLMAEQRQQIALENRKGPRPAVSEIVLEAESNALPSHRPKGVCNLKRS